METGYKYPNGELIYTNDMVLLEHGIKGFVFKDERIGIFSIKYFKDGKVITSSLKNIHKFILKYLG